MSVNVTGNQIVPLLVITLLMAVMAVVLSIWGFIRSCHYANNNPQNNSKYFQLNAIGSNLFNSVSCICVATYCAWLVIYPLDENHFFLKHESIRLRVATTASWYTAKLFLFLIFNGRLYYAFKNSKYRSNYKLFKFLNIFVIIHAIISLIVGYFGVLELRNEIVANIGFNTFHINLAILLFYLSIQFNRRMFYLSTTRVKIELSRSHGDPEEFIEWSSITQISQLTAKENSYCHNNNDVNHGQSIQIIKSDDDDFSDDDGEKYEMNPTMNKIERVNVGDNSETNDSQSGITFNTKYYNHINHNDNKSYRRHVYRQDSIVANREFLRIVTRSTLLLTWIIPFMISISMTWSLHRFVFDTTHYSMCIALLIMSLDSFIDIICVLLLFKYSDPYYNALCKCRYTNISCPKIGCDYCCNGCCNILAKQYVDK